LAMVEEEEGEEEEEEEYMEGEEEEEYEEGEEETVDVYGMAYDDDYLEDDAIYFLLQVTKPSTGEGIGLMLDGCDDGLEVQSIQPGSAAALAVAPTGEQIEEGDIIYEVNGQQEDLGVAMRDQVLKLSVMRYLDFDDDYEDDIEEGGVLEGDELVNDTFTPEDLEPVEEAAGKPAEEEFTSEALVVADRSLVPVEKPAEEPDDFEETFAFEEPYLRILVLLVREPGESWGLSLEELNREVSDGPPESELPENTALGRWNAENPESAIMIGDILVSVDKDHGDDLEKFFNDPASLRHEAVFIRPRWTEFSLDIDREPEEMWGLAMVDGNTVDGIDPLGRIEQYNETCPLSRCIYVGDILDTQLGDEDVLDMLPRTTLNLIVQRRHPPAVYGGAFFELDVIRGPGERWGIGTDKYTGVVVGIGDGVIARSANESADVCVGDTLVAVDGYPFTLERMVSVEGPCRLLFRAASSLIGSDSSDLDPQTADAGYA